MEKVLILSVRVVGCLVLGHGCIRQVVFVLLVAMVGDRDRSIMSVTIDLGVTLSLPAVARSIIAALGS